MSGRRKRFDPLSVFYRGKTDVLWICRDATCEKYRACQDPRACTQLMDLLRTRPRFAGAARSPYGAHESTEN